MTAPTYPKGILPRQEMESRRFEAAKLFEQGLSQARVSRALGVSRTSASRWWRALYGRPNPEAGIPRPICYDCSDFTLYGVQERQKRAPDLDRLKLKVPPGRPSRLTAQQAASLKRAMRKPDSEGRQWTTGRFRDYIYRRFKIRYDVDHVGRLMHSLGWQGRAATRAASGGAL